MILLEKMYGAELTGTVCASVRLAGGAVGLLTGLV